jgi:hypothetical protein
LLLRYSPPSQLSNNNIKTSAHQFYKETSPSPKDNIAECGLIESQNPVVLEEEEGFYSYEDEEQWLLR